MDDPFLLLGVKPTLVSPRDRGLLLLCSHSQMAVLVPLGQGTDFKRPQHLAFLLLLYFDHSLQIDEVLAQKAINR